VCIDYVASVDKAVTCYNIGLEPNLTDGACYDLNHTVKAIFNFTLAKNHDIERKLPSEEYLEYEYTQLGFLL